MNVSATMGRSTRYVVGLAVGAAVACLLVLAQGESVGAFFGAIVDASFSSPTALLNLVRWTAPLLLSGLAYVVGARAGIFNCGVEGQVVVGACVAAIVGANLPLPALLLVPLTALAGAAAATLWAVPAAWLFRRYGINEVVTTLMLNYVAVLLCNLVVREFFIARTSGGAESITVTSAPLATEARISRFIGASDASWTIVLTVLLVAAGAYVLLMTRTGYELTAVGDGYSFSRYAGVDASRLQYRAFLVSAAIGGLVGAFEVQGVLGRYIDGSLTNFGWNGILVGLIGMNNPVGILGSSTFLGVLNNGQLAVQQFTAVSPYMIQLIAALVILVFAIDPMRKVIDTFRRRHDG